MTRIFVAIDPMTGLVIREADTLETLEYVVRNRPPPFDQPIMTASGVIVDCYFAEFRPGGEMYHLPTAWD